MADHTLWHETLHDQFGQYFAVDNVLYHEKPITRISSSSRMLPLAA